MIGWVVWYLVLYAGQSSISSTRGVLHLLDDMPMLLSIFKITASVFGGLCS